MKRLLIILACLGVGSTVAYAQSKTTEEQAEDYFRKGDAAYNLQKYDEAVKWFEKAYETWPQPEFLYNIAQSYRLAGNCKKALHFYKRFKSLKEKDTENPLSAKKKKEVEKFIKDLEECAAKAEDSASQPPDGLDNPNEHGNDGNDTTGGDTTGGDTTGGDTTATGNDTTGGETEVAVKGDGKGDDDDEEISFVEKDSGTTPKLLSARALLGPAIVSAGDLQVPVQPSFGLVAGYPLAAGPIQLDLGAGFSYSPLPYESMPGVQEQGTLIGVRAVVAATYPVNPKIGLRGDLGFGIASMGGLVEGNPFTDDRSAGSFTMPSFRFGVAADYALTPNVVATLSPFGLAFSPAPEEAFMSSLVEIDILVGVGYRM